jgi:hypothetical protein
VGGSVENDVGPGVFKNLAQARPVQDVHHEWPRASAVALANQLLFDGEHLHFRPLDEEQLSWSETGDLTAQFTADAAAGTGDHHGPSGEQGADVPGLQLDGRAAQEVLHFHGAQLADLDFPQRKFGQRGDGAEAEFGLL